MFNATFNNISAISWLSVLLMEETGGTGENHRPVTSHEQTLPNNVISSTPCHERDSLLTTSVVIGTDCIGNCKSNYHTITVTTAPKSNGENIKLTYNVLIICKLKHCNCLSIFPFAIELSPNCLKSTKCLLIIRKIIQIDSFIYRSYYCLPIRQ